METPPFQGVIGDDWRDSTPWWPEVTRPPEGAPNVLLVVLDDVGFAQLGCYGSDIATPTIDGLAAEGVRLTNFHTTALCSPTRACLLTGRNHHRNGLGRVADLAVGFPGYNGHVPKENGFLSEVLRQAGYASYAVGKWHLTPDDQTHMAAPRHSWPLARGFDRWYGFHGGETHQFVPALFHDNHAIRPPRSIDEGYHLSADLADQAITQLADLRAVDVDQPFFLYFCTGACHSPHHAPSEWIERYRGHFDKGWDVWRDEIFARQIEMGLFDSDTEMAPRPPWVPPWEDLPDEAKRVAARFMECFAAFLSYTDAQLARVLEFLEQTGDRDQTLVILVSDNGASSEGGPDGSINDNRLQNFDAAGPKELARRIDEIGGPRAHNNYPWGWTMAGNTPFKRWKREVHEGGVADPCIVSWPARIGSAAVAYDASSPTPSTYSRRCWSWHRSRSLRRSSTSPKAQSTASASLPCWDRKEPLALGTALPSTSRCSEAVPSTTTGGRRSPSNPSVPSTTTASTGMRRSARTSGSSTTLPSIRPKSMTLPTRSPTGSPTWWDDGGSKHAATRCFPSTTGCSTH